MDVTATKKMQESLRKANDLLRLAVVVRDAYDVITVQDLNGRILAWNPAAVKMYGWTEAEAIEMNIRDLIPEGLREESLVAVQRLSRAEILQPYHTKRIAKNGHIVTVVLTATALVNDSGQMYAISTTERKSNQAEK
jgi:two-component system CheB/CheR fusion protein